MLCTIGLALSLSDVSCTHYLTVLLTYWFWNLFSIFLWTPCWFRSHAILYLLFPCRAGFLNLGC